MTDRDTASTDFGAGGSPDGGAPDLTTLQDWTYSIGRMQQLMLQFWAEQAKIQPPILGESSPLANWMHFSPLWNDDAHRAAERQADFLSRSLDLWNRFLSPTAEATAPAKVDADRDRRFRADAWRSQPFFDLIRQSYLLIADHLLGNVAEMEGLEPDQRERLRFATQAWLDAISPSNFAFTNPEVIERTIESGGQNLVAGLQHMLADIQKGQLTQTADDGFVLGHTIAATPGKVVFETPLFQLIHYAPTTEKLGEVPLLIFPPWINRFYILDLSPEKSFIKWAVDQGLSTFVVSWKSADESTRDIGTDDYVLAQVQAIDTVRALLGVKSVHTIGYCVAGTTLAMTLALLAARRQSGKVKSATFFTSQVDFADAGELKLFVDDEQLQMISQLAEATGYTDGRYMAATFNLLRGRDLIWSYVVNNYLMGNDYTPFDLLHWNSDLTNLPAKWHIDYLTSLYRDNRLVQPGGVTIDGTPLDLRKVKTPAYIQAGREDHIAPPQSVWKMTECFSGPHRFVLAGSGHIAGVVNPPAAGKYQYWTNEGAAGSLDRFLADATEHKGSWWPDWIEWINSHGGKQVAATGARIPGGNPDFPAMEDAPGRYVSLR